VTLCYYRPSSLPNYGVLPMSRLETDPMLQRALGALKPAGFATPGLFDCPLCGGRADLYVSVCVDHPNPNYLFELGCFCDCAAEKVGEKILGVKVLPPKRPGRKRARRPR
jgi:hypothetical protein